MFDRTFQTCCEYRKCVTEFMEYAYKVCVSQNSPDVVFVQNVFNIIHGMCVQSACFTEFIRRGVRTKCV